MKDAMENIRSIKRLKVLEYGTDPFNEYTDEAISPVGIVFSYRSTTKNFQTFYRWFYDICNYISITPDHLFEKCYVLQNTFSIKLPDLDERFIVIVF